MKKIYSLFAEETVFSDWVFDIGIVILQFAIGFCFQDQLMHYIVWKDKVWHSQYMYYLYWGLYLVVNLCIIDNIRMRRSLLNMVIVGSIPALAVQTIRLFVQKNAVIIVLGILMAAYGVWMIGQVLYRYAKGRGKRRYIRQAFTKIAMCFASFVVIGQVGNLLEIPAAEAGASFTQTLDEGTLWDNHREMLAKWKEERYRGLDQQEKLELYQGLVDLECLYFGIESVNVEMEQYKEQELLGYYIDEERLISITKETFQAPREEAMGTLLHESHHAYAHAMVDSVDWDDEGLNKNLRVYKDIYTLKNGFENYTDADTDYMAYYNNPVEEQAREYSSEWMPRYIQYIDNEL